MQVAQLLLEQQLKAGLVKSVDLDALIILRDELNKSTIDYRIYVTVLKIDCNNLQKTNKIAKIQARRKKKTSRTN